MDGNWGAGEAGIGAALLALLALAGRGIVALIPSRETRLQAWESSLVQREKDYREKLEAKFERIEAAVALLRTQNGALSIALFDVTGELREHDPGSMALARAAALLRTAFPIETDLPPGMAELLTMLDAEGIKG